MQELELMVKVQAWGGGAGEGRIVLLRADASPSHPAGGNRWWT